MPRPRHTLRGGIKKIVIRPYEKPPQLPTNYYADSSRTILDGSLHLLKSKLEKSSATATSSTADKNWSLQTAYTAATHLVRHDMGGRLYPDVVKTLRTAASLVLPKAPTTALLETCTAMYQSFTEYLMVLQHICSSLDRSWQWNWEGNCASKDGGGDSFWKTGLRVFLERLRQLKLDIDLYQTWLDVLLREWESGTIENGRVLQSVWYLWQDLGLLELLPLQDNLEKHWEKKGRDQSSHLTTTNFLDYCFEKHQTLKRDLYWLPVAWLQNILDRCLFSKFVSLEGSKMFDILDISVREKNDASIQKLWYLAGRLTSTHDLTDWVQRYAGHNPSSTGVAGILEFQAALKRTLVVLGVADIRLKGVWEQVVTSDLAEPLAKHFDAILRSTKKLDNCEPDWLDQIRMGVFVPLPAKDVFEAFYRKDLAKRLLAERFASIDTEKQVCSMLKAECGAAYTSKIEGMFQDVEWSRETMRVYKDSCGDYKPKVDVHVQVLTTGYWPKYPEYPNLILPQSLREPEEHFTNHYKSKYQGRRIKWKYSLGHCVVQTYGLSKPYELVVNLCHALVLTQFSGSQPEWTMPDLMKATGLDDRGEMERTLRSLTLGKDGTRVLRKLDHDNPGKPRATVDDRDKFVINMSFSSNSRRIRINNPSLKETQQEREKTVEAVSRDRLYLLDAVIVRIMKSRKSVLHQDLIPQVSQQLKFPAQPMDIKQRIASLIERDYLERDENDRNRYNYLA